MMIPHPSITITALALMCAGHAIAQDQSPETVPVSHGLTPPESRLSGLIAMLDDDAWIRRERAMQLLGDPNEGFELDMLADTLERGDLSAESRLRLRASARGLFSATTRAGLGVGFGTVRDGGVEIGTVVAQVDQFPAAAMLKPGDLIVGAEGQELTTSDELRAMILSHEPGGTLNLLVLRQNQLLDLDLPLGAYTALRGAAPVENQVADRAIELRWMRQGITLPADETVGGGITVASWIDAGYPDGAEASGISSSRRADRVVHSGSGRDVYVGVGVMHRGRIEPWSDRSNAVSSMGQARQIELSRSMDLTRKRITILKRGLEILDEQISNDDPAVKSDPSFKIKYSTASSELREAQRQLEAYRVEFESIAPSIKPIP